MRDGVRSLPEDPFFWEIECAENTRSRWSKNRAVFESDPYSDVPKQKETTPEAKSLYRSLARRFHPDLAETEEARDARTEVMAEINQAYRDQDIDKLLEIQDRPDITDPERETLGETLIRLIRRVAQLRRLVKDAEQRLTEHQGSDLGTLMGRCDIPEKNPFSFLETMLQEQIDRAKFEWLNQRVREARLWTEVEK